MAAAVQTSGRERVAVVTRTKDRPLLLRRARASVLGQTFNDLVWVIVNDGGDPAPIEAEAEAARKKGVRAIAIHRNASDGMEAASNIGVRAVETRYAVLHDDDDSWEPGFLAATVPVLEGDQRFVGAVTHTATVTERIAGETIVSLRRRPQNRWLKAVYLADLSVANLFPPISFLYRRDAYDAVGGYDESFPVLGDWEFNLKMAMRGEIAVVNTMLANYHVRESEPEDDARYANSITAQHELHLRQDALFRNRLLRDDLAAERVGLGWMLSLARLQNLPRRGGPGRRQTGAVRSAVDAMSGLFRRWPGRRGGKNS
jgi:glycosyltransferase involved in cell wall biosynthesis